MKKLKYLIKYALKKRIYSKAFVISNLFIGLIIIGITLLPTLINTFSSTPKIDDVIRIVNTSNYNQDEKDLSMYISNYLNTYVDEMGFENKLNFIYEDSIDEEELLNYYDNKHDETLLIVLSQKLINPSLDINDGNNYVLNVDLFQNGLDPNLSSVINLSLINLNRVKYILDNQVDSNLVLDLIPNQVENPNTGGSTSNQLLQGIAPIVVVPLFILITFAVQVIGAEIIEEKSTKAIEIIIASVKPTTHFIAKVASIIIFQIMQMGVMLLFGLVGVVINSLLQSNTSGGQNWQEILAMLDIDIIPVLFVVIICSLLGATLYATYGAILGALSVNQEDYQQVQTPVMMIMMIAYLGTILFGTTNNQIGLLVFNYVPFFSPLAMPISFLLGHIGLLEIVIGLTILIAFIVLSIIIISPLYKASILSYDQSKLVKRVKNAYKNAKALKLNKKLYEENNTNESQ